jgi:hypothetical protein
MDDLLDRVQRIELQIPQIKNKIARRDLLKMVQTVDRAMIEIDKEKVECRRLHRETVRYQELIIKANNLVANLEHHLTFAVLMSG